MGVKKLIEIINGKRGEKVTNHYDDGEIIIDGNKYAFSFGDAKYVKFSQKKLHTELEVNCISLGAGKDPFTGEGLFNELIKLKEEVANYGLDINFSSSSLCWPFTGPSRLCLDSYQGSRIEITGKELENYEVIIKGHP